MKKQPDLVNHPPHYTQGAVECIDAIRSALTPEEFRGYLRGTIMKYLWRLGRKGAPAMDADKAAWYLGRLQKEVQGKPGPFPPGTAKEQ